MVDLKIADLPGMLGAPLCGAPAEVPDLPVVLSLDSRTTEPGQVFWAIEGEQFDGHRFVAAAMKRGAAVAVVKREWIEKHPDECASYLPVEKTGEALLRFAGRYADRFSARRIAITGSNGKTTTKEMIRAVLSTRAPVRATPGNFNNRIGVPLTLFGLEKKHRYAVVELGTNHPGEIEELTKTVVPEMAVITTIGDSHLEFFGDRAGVFREKKSIVKGLVPGGWLVVNSDDPFLSRIRPTQRYRLLTYGIDRGEIRPSRLSWDDSGCARFAVGKTEFRLAVPGRHSLSNALAAIAVGKLFRIPAGEIAEVLRRFRGAPLRMELRKSGGVRIVADCYNANPSSMQLALETVGKMKVAGRRIAVLGEMLELGGNGRALHRAMGKLLVQSDFDLLITVGSLAREIGKGALAAGWDRNRWIHTADAVAGGKEVVSRVTRNDVVLVKGSRGVGLERVVEILERKEVKRGH